MIENYEILHLGNGDHRNITKFSTIIERNAKHTDNRIQRNHTQCRGTESQVPLGNLFPSRHRRLFGYVSHVNFPPIN